jgi:hypothetical protein
VVEVPDVFFLSGKWWMTCLTGNGYGARADFNDPNIRNGTIYASSDKLEGPYTIGPDRILIGSSEPNGYSCRTVEFQGKRYLFYTQRERSGRVDHGAPTHGTMTTPKELRVSADGKLEAVYSRLVENCVGKPVVQGVSVAELTEIPDWRWGTPGAWTESGQAIEVVSPFSWTTRAFGPALSSFVLTGDVELATGRSIGILFRRVTRERPYREPASAALAVLLDYEEQCLKFTALKNLETLDARARRLERQRKYSLRIVAKAEFFEVYLDDVLLLNLVRYQPEKGAFGLFLEKGKGRFSNIRVTELHV